jgi:ParB/RepB/Spo0J family partition protein
VNANEPEAPDHRGPASAVVEQIAIHRIKVGLRRRKELGDLESLKASIEAHGLFHPILLRGEDDKLVCGRRRLEACRALGWKTIPAQRVDGISDEEIHKFELAENSWVNLSPEERSLERTAWLAKKDETRARKMASRSSAVSE